MYCIAPISQVAVIISSFYVGCGWSLECGAGLSPRETRQISNYGVVRWKQFDRFRETPSVNDSPHLLAIIESKMAQVRTRLEHNSFDKAQALLAEVKIYADELRQSVVN
jgi:hypothetical protein